MSISSYFIQVNLIRDCLYFQVGGVVFFSAEVADKMLVLHAFPPLDACTYYGLDNGAPPIQVDHLMNVLYTKGNFN